LPFAGIGLSRFVLDEALLRRAGEFGAEIRRGQTVSLKQDRAHIVLTSPGSADMKTDTLFLATGKHDLRGIRRPTAGVPELVGFKVHLRLAPAERAALAGHVEIMLLDRGYAGLQMVEQDMANLCLLVERSRLQDAGGRWDGLLADLRRTEPQLQTRLAGAVALAPRPLSIFRVPYGFVHAPLADDPPGIFRLGDQMGVTRPSPAMACPLRCTVPWLPRRHTSPVPRQSPTIGTSAMTSPGRSAVPVRSTASAPW
jgi:hypothetical protein